MAGAAGGSRKQVIRARYGPEQTITPVLSTNVRGASSWRVSSGAAPDEAAEGS
jgi:hypothetical protein